MHTKEVHDTMLHRIFRFFSLRSTWYTSIQCYNEKRDGTQAYVNVVFLKCEKYRHIWWSKFMHSDTGSGNFTSFPLVSPFSIHSTVTLSLSSCSDVTIAWCIRPAEREEMLCLLCAARDSATVGSRLKTNLWEYHLKIRSNRKTPTLHQHLKFYDSCRESWPLK